MRACKGVVADDERSKDCDDVEERVEWEIRGDLGLIMLADGGCLEAWQFTLHVNVCLNIAPSKRAVERARAIIPPSVDELHELQLRSTLTGVALRQSLLRCRPLLVSGRAAV